MKWQQSWWWLSLGGAHIVDFTWITLNFAEQLDNNWSQVYMLSQVTRLSSNQDNLVTKYRNDEKHFRDCQTFLESRSKWGDDIQGLPHLSGYGIFKPDPCRFKGVPHYIVRNWYPTLQTFLGFITFRHFQAWRGTWGEGGGGKYPGYAEVRHYKVTVEWILGWKNLW